MGRGKCRGGFFFFFGEPQLNGSVPTAGNGGSGCSLFNEKGERLSVDGEVS